MNKPSFVKRTEEERVHDRVIEHVNKKRSLKDEHELIKSKQSKLSARERRYVVELMETKNQKP